MLHIMNDVWLIIIGLFAGTLGSLVGLGGGFIIVPLITLLFALPSRIVAGTSTAVIVINSITSTWVYHKQRRIDLKSGLAFALMSVPGAFLGARLSSRLTAHEFDISFGILLIIASILLVFKPSKSSRPKPLLPVTAHRSIVDATGAKFEYGFNLPFGLVAAFLTGFLSSLFGIGGGTVMVPTMVLVLGFPAHLAVATSMFVVLVSSIVGTASHAMLGDIDWFAVLFLAIGAWVGGQIGPRISQRVPAKILMRILAVLMVLTALRLIFS